MPAVSDAPPRLCSAWRVARPVERVGRLAPYVSVSQQRARGGEAHCQVKLRESVERSTQCKWRVRQCDELHIEIDGLISRITDEVARADGAESTCVLSMSVRIGGVEEPAMQRNESHTLIQPNAAKAMQRDDSHSRPLTPKATRARALSLILSFPLSLSRTRARDAEPTAGQPPALTMHPAISVSVGQGSPLAARALARRRLMRSFQCASRTRNCSCLHRVLEADKPKVVRCECTRAVRCE